jgi:hypothetical protein
MRVGESVGTREKANADQLRWGQNGCEASGSMREQLEKVEKGVEEG